MAIRTPARGAPGASRSSSGCPGTSPSRSARGPVASARARSRSRIDSISPTNSACWSWSGDRLTLTKKSVDRPGPRSQAATCSAGLGEDPPAEGQDQPVLLGQRDELVRRDEAAGRVAPADERLDAGDPARVELDDRLVVDRELAAADAPRELRARARGGRRSPRASSARRPRRGACRRPWPCTSRRRRCAAARRRARRARAPTAMPMLPPTEISWPWTGTAPAARR